MCCCSSDPLTSVSRAGGTGECKTTPQSSCHWFQSIQVFQGVCERQAQISCAGLRLGGNDWQEWASTLKKMDFPFAFSREICAQTQRAGSVTLWALTGPPCFPSCSSNWYSVKSDKVSGEKEQESERIWGLLLWDRDWDRLLDHASYPKSLWTGL